LGALAFRRLGSAPHPQFTHGSDPGIRCAPEREADFIRLLNNDPRVRQYFVPGNAFPYSRLIFLYGGRPRELVNRSQQLARYFAETVPVSYVPYRSIREWLDHEWRAAPWPPLATNARIEILPTPATVWMGRRWRAPGRITGAIVARQIRNALRRHRLGLEEVLFLAYTPVAADVMRHFPGAPLHYDCADDHEHWHGSTTAMRKLNRDNEAYLASRARTVTATARPLAEKMRRFNVGVGLVPNGVDHELFAAASNGSSPPTDLAGLPRPLIGFVGATAGYVDAELVASLAGARIGTLVFVGPLAALERRLRNHERIRFLGRRDYGRLPHYLHSFDVTVIPANRHAASLAANPGKLYQYLASGRPVVVTDLPEFEPFREVVYRASSSEEFIAQVGAALREPPGWQIERRKMAEHHSWRRRAARVLEIAGGACPGDEREPAPFPPERAFQAVLGD